MKENMKTRIVTLLAALLLTAASTYAQTKIATTISVAVANADGIKAGEDARVTVTMTPALDGIATISVKPEGGDAKPYNVAVVNGTGTYYVNNLAEGSYTITAKYEGDDVYAASQTAAPCNLYVPMITTSLAISIDKSSISVGETATVSIQLDQSMNAVVTGRRVNHGEEFTGNTNLRNGSVALVNGKGTLELSGFDAGIYDIRVEYAGNDEIKGSTSNVLTLTVSKQETSISVNDITAITAGEDATVAVSATPAINGFATVTVDNTDYTVALVDGEGTCIIPNLAEGTHSVTASIAENDKYLGSTAEAKQVTVSAGTDPAIVRNAVVTVTTTPDDYNGIVKVTVNGKDYNVAISNGKGEVVLPQLDAGTHNVTASIAGDNKYLSSTTGTNNVQIVSVPGISFSFPNGQTWMTWCDDYAWLKPEGVKAYTLSAVSGTTVTLTEVTTDNIPSHTPLLLEKKGDAVTPTKVITGTGSGTLVSTEGTGATFWGNASDAAIATDNANFINPEGYVSYVLRSGQFIRVDQNQGLAAHRCVLNVSSNTGNAPALTISTSVTGITTTNYTNLTNSDDAWYSLDGRRLNGKPTKKGIYINGGRKVVVK